MPPLFVLQQISWSARSLGSQGGRLDGDHRRRRRLPPALGCAAIERGARLVGANQDPTFPIEDGLELPGNGSTVRLIAAVTGAVPEYMGKPEPHLLRQIEAETGVPLAQMVMDAKLKLRLRVLIPAVENAVAGNAFRPLDVFPSRKGLTVEIGNTDAEGRLVLADALALADEEKPDLLIDLGTLTGAARVALGPDLPPFYTNDESLAQQLLACAKRENDPLWRLPLWPPYDSWLDSKVANVRQRQPGGGFHFDE